MKPKDGRAKNGGARTGSGPRVRRIRLDDETTSMLRILSKQSGTDEQTIVKNLIKREWSEMDQECQPRKPAPDPV